MAQTRFGVSERFACRAVGQNRSTQRLPSPVPAEDDAEIRADLRKFAKDRPRWGWRRAATHLRNKGHLINNKHVRRIWREEGLRVPTGRKKKRLTGVGTHIGAISLIRANALWAMDFQFDRMVDGQQIKLLNIIDEYTRECLTIVVDHNIDAERVVGTLVLLAVERGQAPAFVRFDNWGAPRISDSG
jgi:putative transposase